MFKGRNVCGSVLRVFFVVAVFVFFCFIFCRGGAKHCTVFKVSRGNRDSLSPIWTISLRRSLVTVCSGRSKASSASSWGVEMDAVLSSEGICS